MQMRDPFAKINISYKCLSSVDVQKRATSTAECRDDSLFLPRRISARAERHARASSAGGAVLPCAARPRGAQSRALCGCATETTGSVGPDSQALGLMRVHPAQTAGLLDLDHDLDCPAPYLRVVTS